MGRKTFLVQWQYFWASELCRPGFKSQVCYCVLLIYKCLLRIPGPVGIREAAGNNRYVLVFMELLF